MAKKILSGDGWSFEPAGAAKPEETRSLPDAEQKARVKVEKRAKGKEVTVLAGFVLSPADRKKLAADLKKHCGAGGADGEDGIEIQGNHRDKVAAFVAARGWRIK